jgi:hypothetical protein
VRRYARVWQRDQVATSGFGRDQTVFDPWHYVPVLAQSQAR